jgi:hypothetical protein
VIVTLNSPLVWIDHPVRPQAIHLFGKISLKSAAGGLIKAIPRAEFGHSATYCALHKHSAGCGLGGQERAAFGAARGGA